MNDFEKQWLHKLESGLQKIGRVDLYEKALASYHESANWSDNLVDLLNTELTQDEVIDVMCGCACKAPKDYLKILQKEFAATKDLKHVHKLLQLYFEKSITTYKNLNNEQLTYIIDNDMGMAGKLDGNVISAVKIPKEFHKYYQTKDPIEKRYHYCHCPRIRQAFKTTNKPVDKNYCYCGAGFYRDIWEFILQRPVEVKLIQSLTNGDDVCEIKVYLESSNYV